MSTYRYTYTGSAPTVFPALTGIRAAQGLPGEVEPGEVVESPEPLLSALLVPVDDATAHATDQLADAEPDLTDAEAAALGITQPTPARRGRRTKPVDDATAHATDPDQTHLTEEG